MKRRLFSQVAAAVVAVATLGLAPIAQAADEAPDAKIKRLSDEVITAIKSDKPLQGGDMNRIMALVDSKIMPTSSAGSRRSA
jgi:phospholipid transport system substrate-binding protein